MEQRIEAALRQQYEDVTAVYGVESPCRFCGGMGAVTLNVPLHHPLFGRSFHCPCQRETILVR